MGLGSFFKKAVKGVTDFADDALGFDPNGGGMVGLYDAAGTAAFGVPVGSIGSAGVNLGNGDVNGALNAGLNGAMNYAGGQLGGALSGTGGGLNGIMGALGGGQQGGILGMLGGGMQGGQSMQGSPMSINVQQPSQSTNLGLGNLARVGVIQNKNPLTNSFSGNKSSQLTDILLEKIISKQGGRS
jgi:hypothetical protein